MKEDRRVIGLGLAYLEGKIQSTDLHVPQRRDEIPSFLASHPEMQFYAGGSLPNVLSTFVRISGSPNIKLFYCVGDDTLGQYYSQDIDQRLGKPKISKGKQTGAWIGIYNNGLTEGLDFYGAACDITVSRRELRQAANELFITDVTACKIPKTLSHIKKVLATLAENNGLFALSLSGAAIDTSATREQLEAIFSSLEKVPDLIFGNASEVRNITGEEDVRRAIEQIFPTSRLVVITQAEKGTIMRLNTEIIEVPTMPIPQNMVIDETGAGDSYMGTMLALLVGNTFSKSWETEEVTHAAKIAHFASSLVIQSMHSRITPEQSQQVLSYAASFVV